MPLSTTTDSENCQYQFHIPSNMLTVHKNYHFICQVILHCLLNL